MHKSTNNLNTIILIHKPILITTVIFNPLEYLDEHPCLCTSRFRHVLHQLNQEQHKKLASICGDLQTITSVS